MRKAFLRRPERPRTERGHGNILLEKKGVEYEKADAGRSTITRRASQHYKLRGPGTSKETRKRENTGERRKKLNDKGVTWGTVPVFFEE